MGSASSRGASSARPSVAVTSSSPSVATASNSPSTSSTRSSAVATSDSPQSGASAPSAEISLPSDLKVALVCDWLTNVGGAEKVLLSIHQLFPSAPIYTSQYNPRGISWFQDADVRTGWLQIFPAKLRRLLSPLRQRYFSHLDLSEYDLIISVTGAEAKAINFSRSRGKTSPSRHRDNSSISAPDSSAPGTSQDASTPSTSHSSPASDSTSARQPVHLCYCHVPTQYYWQMYDDYVKNPGFGPLNFLVRPFFKLFVNRLRRADYTSAQKPTDFITISNYSAKQIKKYYHRDAVVIPPPVAVENFAKSVENLVEKPVENSPSHPISTKTEQIKPLKPEQNHPKSPQKPEHQSISILPTPYFLNFSRQVSWKRLDLAIRACQKTGDRLVLVGDGPEHSALLKLAHARPATEIILDDRPAQKTTPPRSASQPASAHPALESPSWPNPAHHPLKIPLPPGAATSPDGRIIFLPATDQAHLRRYLENASAFIFPSLEPFGIAPVEALAAGVPVIAYGKGGATDYITDGQNGLLFPQQTADSLATTLQRFHQLVNSAKTATHHKSASVKSSKLKKSPLADPVVISRSAQYYSEQRFQAELKEYIYAHL